MSASLRRLPERPRPLAIGLIGAGRAGSVLGAALSTAGHRLVGVTARSDASRSRATALLPHTPILSPTAVAQRASDLLLLTVPDDAVATVAGELAAAGALREGQVVAHTSGAHGVGLLHAVTTVGARPLALHPAMTFTGRPDDLPRLAGVSYAVTAEPQLRPLATRLVADLSGAVEWVAESDRPLYHASLAHGANHLVTLVNEAVDRLRDAGVTEPARLLAPLLRAALDNALARGDAALTGPVARGDAGTVAGHLAVLALTAPKAVPAYRALARRSTERAWRAGNLSAEAVQRLEDVLGAGQADHATDHPTEVLA